MKKKSFYYGLIIFLLVFFLFVVFLDYDQPGELKISFFDVGQGDSSLIQVPMGQNVLIDGGPNDKVLFGLARELAFWDNKIDLMILTHPHDDHFSGLIPVLERYQVDRILYTDVLAEDQAYKYWLDLAKSEKVEMINVSGLDYINLGGDCGLNVFYPKENLAGQVKSNLNNTSIVFQLDCVGHKVLLMGDAEEDVEEFLVESNLSLESEVLKVGHHGSNTSNNINFLEAVDPEFAIISVGEDNYFGHPSQQVINRLERSEIKVYQTDLVGNISISWPQNDILIETDVY